MAYEDVFGHGASLGEKRSVLIFEGATPTFCFSILNNFFPNRFQYVDLHVNPRVVSAIQLYEAQQISSQLQRNQTFTFSLSLSLSLFPFVRKK
jgi:hypothetical protein